MTEIFKFEQEEYGRILSWVPTDQETEQAISGLEQLRIPGLNVYLKQDGGIVIDARDKAVTVFTNLMGEQIAFRMEKIGDPEEIPGKIFFQDTEGNQLGSIDLKDVTFLEQEE